MPIETPEEHKAALERIDALMGADDDTDEAEELDRLVNEVVAYEAIHFPIPKET